MPKLHILTATVAAAILLAPLSFATAPQAAPAPTRVPTTTPNNPNDPPSSDTYSCRDQLGYLRRVYEVELDAINDPNRVWVTPVCENDDAYGLMRNDGNAGALRGHIAENDAIMSALLGKDFRPEDVVGIRMTGEDSVVIFVHPFHH